MGFFDSIFKWISDLFSKLVEFIKKLLPIVMLCVALWFGFGGVWAPTIFGSTLTIEGTAGVCLALGTSFLLAPDETAALVGRVAAGVADAAEKVIDAAVPLIQKVGSGIWDVISSNPLFWLAAGYLGYTLLTRDSGEKVVVSGNQ